MIENLYKITNYFAYVTNWKIKIIPEYWNKCRTIFLIRIWNFNFPGFEKKKEESIRRTFPLPTPKNTSTDAMQITKHKICQMNNKMQNRKILKTKLKIELKTATNGSIISQYWFKPKKNRNWNCNMLPSFWVTRQ